jgi:hypothetical protein
MSALGSGSFASLWMVIVAISVHDGFLVLAHRGIIAEEERNPFGNLLLRWNHGDVWLLLTAKAAGTICAAALLLILYWRRPPLGWVACAATAAFQVILLLFLYYW